MTLEIVLPTYNHPSYIEKALSYLPKFEAFDYLLSVIDSSTNDETKNLLLPYLGEKVRYRRIDSHIDVDEKTVLALKEATGEFVFLCGDRYFPNVEGIFKAIDFQNTKTELFIVYDHSFQRHCKVFQEMEGEKFSGREEFFQKHFWQATLYGGSICKRSIFERMDVKSAVERFCGSGFIYPSVLALYAEGPYEAMEGDFLICLPVKGDSGWILNKSFAQIWLKKYPEAVRSLKDVFSEDTISAIVRTTGYRTNFLTKKGLAIFRLSDNYNYKIYRAYKKEIKEYKACSAFSAWLIAILPKFVFQAIRAAKRALKPKAQKEAI